MFLFQGASTSRVGHYFAVGMQDFTPESGRYDVIWLQWTIGHLTDGKTIGKLGMSHSGSASFKFICVFYTSVCRLCIIGHPSCNNN